MKKIVFTLILLFAFNGYAQIKNCKQTLDLSENMDVFTSMRTDKNYKYGKTTGKLCFLEEDKFLYAIPLENGKYAGYMEVQGDYDKDNIALYMYASTLKLYDFIHDNGSDISNIQLLANIFKDDKFFADIYIPGNKAFNMDFNKGDGSITYYREKGKKALVVPVKQFSASGTGQMYDRKDKLCATIEFKDDTAISAQYIVNGKPGRSFSDEEIANIRSGTICNE